MVEATEPRTDQCPLCEQPNACVMAATGDPSLPCWCRDVRVPKRLIAKLPIESQGKRCICGKCIDAFRRAPTIPDSTGR